MLILLAPFIIAALVAAFIIFMKVSEYRANARRIREGKPPLTQETPIVNVIDWSRRK